MKPEIQRVLNLRNYFRISKSYTNLMTYHLERPSVLLRNNIYINWLQSIHSKIHKNMPIFTCKKYLNDNQPLPFGFIINDFKNYDKTTLTIGQYNEEFAPKESEIELNVIVPQQDTIQYFTQWQRYRKYWWSSITTTPSLFSINEIKYEGDTTEASIIAQFPWGHHNVETISTCSGNNKASHLKCTMSLERAKFILLLDGLNNSRPDYLKLHRNMTPYKVSFALKCEEISASGDLKGLAKLLHHRLKCKDISSYLPSFTHSLEIQIRENLQLGVTYTAILSVNTLTSGIFHLLNSNTMLKEEIHVADFDSYAALICSRT